MAQAGRPESFAGEQVVGNSGARDRVLVLENQARMLESTLLAGGIDIDQHIGDRQDGSEAVHRWQTRKASVRLWVKVAIPEMKGSRIMKCIPARGANPRSR
jgi:hypothetical protein